MTTTTITFTITANIAQRLNATLWNTTDGTVLAVRKLNIKPAAQQS